MDKEFEEGVFTEEELRVIKRLLPTAFEGKARVLSRRQFFAELSISKCCRNISTIKRTLHVLSKREKLKGPLSSRSVVL